MMQKVTHTGYLNEGMMLVFQNQAQVKIAHDRLGDSMQPLITFQEALPTNFLAFPDDGIGNFSQNKDQNPYEMPK